MKKLLIISLSFLFFVFSGQVFSEGEETPLQLAGAKTITVDQAKAMFDAGVVFVDPRKDTDWDAGRIPEAEHLELTSRFSAKSLSRFVKQDDPVVFYCNGVKCKVSYDAAEKAVGWGFSDVNWFRGGMPDWKNAGYPVE